MLNDTFDALSVKEENMQPVSVHDETPTTAIGEENKEKPGVKLQKVKVHWLRSTIIAGEDNKAKLNGPGPEADQLHDVNVHTLCPEMDTEALKISKP